MRKKLSSVTFALVVIVLSVACSHPQTQGSFVGSDGRAPQSIEAAKIVRLPDLANTSVGKSSPGHWSAYRQVVIGHHGAVNTVEFRSSASTWEDTVSLLVPVSPGHAYSFSAAVDPRGIQSGSFNLKIDRADGAASYAAFFRGNGPEGRYYTGVWLCPEGVTQAMLVLQASKLSLPGAATLKFSAPELFEWTNA